MADWGTYFAGKRVWVTGASSGIGRSLVDALGSAGVVTVASARREVALTELAERYPSVHALTMDIADFDSIEEMAKRAWDILGGIDVLINNAGVSQRSVFAESDPAALQRVLDVDLSGTMRVTHAVLNRMLAAGSGHLVAITSFAARVPTPVRSAYTAAKMGLHGLFDCIRSEVASRGIAVTLVVPGWVRTDISRNAITATGEKHATMDDGLAAGMPADTAAERILTGIARRRREFSVATTFRFRYGYFMRRFFPSLFFKMVARAKVT